MEGRDLEMQMSHQYNNEKLKIIDFTFGFLNVFEEQQTAASKSRQVQAAASTGLGRGRRGQTFPLDCRKGVTVDVLNT